MKKNRKIRKKIKQNVMKIENKRNKNEKKIKKNKIQCYIDN